MKQIGRALKWAVLVVFGLFLLLQLWWLAHVVAWRWVNPDSTRFMEIRLGELHQRRPNATLRHAWVDYARISGQLKRAVVVAEDARFLDHQGFDWDGIQQAMARNQKKGRFVAGGSTISQQLAKNLFLTPTRSLWRKGQEALITVMLETVLDKRRILEIYLNVIEWGDGVFGAEAAARHYYGIPAARLDAGQAALLAARIPSPRYYDRNRLAPGQYAKAAALLIRMPSARLP